MLILNRLDSLEDEDRYLCYYLGVNVNVWHGYLYVMSCYELKVCV